MGPCHSWQVAIAAILSCAGASAARADSLADARKAVDSSDYPTAEPLLHAALKEGTASPSELAEIYRLSGIVEAALGNTANAQAAFSRWLALEPKGTLPQGTSPKLMRPFNVAQDLAKKRGALEVKAETADNPPAVTLVVVNDPMKLVAGAKVYFSVDHKREESLAADGNKRVTIELGAGKRIDLRLQAVDEHGNRVAELGSKDVPIVITGAAKEDKVVVANNKERTKLAPETRQVEARQEPSEPPWYFEWWSWGIAAGVTTLAGGYFAYRTYDEIQQLNTLNANSYDHVWADAQAVESAAKRDLVITDVLAGTASAFAIGAVLLYVMQPHREVRAAVAPTSGGATLMLGGRF